MVKRLKRLLISTAFLSVLALPGQTAFADSAHGNSANAAGQTKTTTSQSSSASQQNNTKPSSSTPGSSNHSQGSAGTSGTYNQPQPYSKADHNNTGANSTSSTNPYKSTRNGSPSLNGNGKGLSVGKPCAGCVGKADNKNPKGQAPNGSDHNKGYECDKNHGIGKSNPAHTGCKTISPTTCSSNCGKCTVNCGSNHDCVLLCGGRGGGEVLGASTTVGGLGAGELLGVSTELPNTGLHDGVDLWAVLAVVSFVLSMVYWRQLVAPLIKTHQ